MYRRRFAHEEQVKLVRQGIARAFAKLRKNDFIARMNFSCCGGCAVYEIGYLAKAKCEKKGVSNPSGFAFYHRQDGDHLREYGEVFIGFGGHEDEEDKHFSISPAEAAEKIVTALCAEGLEVDWNGDVTQRIHVTSKYFAEGGEND